MSHNVRHSKHATTKSDVVKTAITTRATTTSEQQEIMAQLPQQCKVDLSYVMDQHKKKLQDISKKHNIDAALVSKAAGIFRQPIKIDTPLMRKLGKGGRTHFHFWRERYCQIERPRGNNKEEWADYWKATSREWNGEITNADKEKFKKEFEASKLQRVQGTEEHNDITQAEHEDSNDEELWGEGEEFLEFRSRRKQYFESFVQETSKWGLILQSLGFEFILMTTDYHDARSVKYMGSDLGMLFHDTEMRSRLCSADELAAFCRTSKMGRLTETLNNINRFNLYRDVDKLVESAKQSDDHAFDLCKESKKSKAHIKPANSKRIKSKQSIQTNLKSAVDAQASYSAASRLHSSNARIEHPLEPTSMASFNPGIESQTGDANLASSAVIQVRENYHSEGSYDRIVPQSLGTGVVSDGMDQPWAVEGLNSIRSVNGNLSHNDGAVMLDPLFTGDQQVPITHDKVLTISIGDQVSTELRDRDRDMVDASNIPYQASAESPVHSHLQNRIHQNDGLQQASQRPNPPNPHEQTTPQRQSSFQSGRSRRKSNAVNPSPRQGRPLLNSPSLVGVPSTNQYSKVQKTRASRPTSQTPSKTRPSKKELLPIIKENLLGMIKDLDKRGILNSSSTFPDNKEIERVFSKYNACWSAKEDVLYLLTNVNQLTTNNCATLAKEISEGLVGIVQRPPQPDPTDQLFREMRF